MMFWKNKELEELRHKLDIVENRVEFTKELDESCRSKLKDALSIDIEKVNEGIEFLAGEWDKKFKDLETMCLTTISQLQNVQLAHAERLRALETEQDNLEDEIRCSTVILGERLLKLEERYIISSAPSLLKKMAEDRKAMEMASGIAPENLQDKLEKPKELRKK